MRSKNSMYNLLAATLLQAVNMIIGIILPKVMLISFGSEVNGLVSSIKQFISYLTLVEAGLAGACIYNLYKPLSDKDYNQINAILSGAKKFYNKSGIIFSVLALILAICFPYIAKSSSTDNLTISALVFILGVNGSLEFFSMGKYRALLTADQKSYIISIIQVIGQILNCIIIIILALNKFNIVAVQIFASSSYIVRSILLSTYVKKKYKSINFNVQPDTKALSQRWDVLFHQVGSMIVFNSPVALITIFCSLIQVSIYSIYNMVFSGINSIIGIFNTGLVAGIGDIISKNDIKHLQSVYREYECGYYMILTWIYSCSYILIIPFISIYTKGINDANYINENIASLFIIVGILNGLRIPQSTVVNAAGHFKETRYRVLIEIIINLSVSILLVRRMGIEGVLIGAICSYSYRTIDFIIYAPKNIIKIPVKETIKRIVNMIILSTIIIVPFETIIQVQLNNFMEWFIYAMIISIGSLVVVIMGNYISDKYIITKLINRILNVINIENNSKKLDKIKG